MAQIMKTTLVPSKLELLTGWARARPWFKGAINPEFEIVGGFRLDDPDGEIGFEFFLLRDHADGIEYFVPVSYRSAPLPGADQDGSLIGTAEHGILGTRYVYDGPVDPAWRSVVEELLNGEAEPQHRTESETPDRTVRLIPGTEAGVISESMVVRTPGDTPVEGFGAVMPWDGPEGETRTGMVLRGVEG